MGKMKCAFVTGSLLMTGATVLVGIAFFGSYWLCSFQMANEAGQPGGNTYTNIPSSSGYYDRGLWEQCGDSCTWVWTNSWAIETKKFYPMQWPLAVQILYFIGAALLLFVEIFSRVQMCCEKNTHVYAALGILVMVSTACQAGALSTFGWGANKHYNVQWDPQTISKMLQNYVSDMNHANPAVNVAYAGACFWTGAVGLIISFFVGMFYFFAACECHKKYAKRYGDDDDDKEKIDDDEDD